MHIGMIGGIGPVATDFYYRGLIKKFEDEPGRFDLTIAHADTSTLLKNMAAGQAKEQAAIFSRLTRRLRIAGAEVVVVTSVSGHFCIEEFISVSELPVVNLVTSVAKYLRNEGYERIGILGTKKVIESRMYGALEALEIVVPAQVELVHKNYVDMAISGVLTEEQRRVFFDCGLDMCNRQGTQAVLLAGTDLYLAFQDRDCGFTTIDCVPVHITDIIKPR